MFAFVALDLVFQY